MLVGMERDSGYMNAPLQYYTSALYSFADRLEESPSVRVQATHRDMSRSDAVRNAKAEKEAYVVWLQLRTDSLDADRSLAAAGEVFIEYSLYEPATAKLLSSGRAYQRATRKGGVIVGPSTGGTSVMQGEYMVKLAARDAAEKVLSALHLPSQRKTLP
jgi:hypothetical protein